MRVYRGPAELEPRATADGQQNRISLAGLRGLGIPIVDGNPEMCPAWGCGVPRGYLGPPFRVPWFQMGPGATSVVDQPPPLPPGSAPTTSGCAPGQYQDAAGNCTSDWHNPYSLNLPQPSPVVGAPTPLSLTQPGTTLDSSGASPTVASTSWFTDPTQELISGIPNWGLVAAAGALLLMMRGKR